MRICLISLMLLSGSAGAVAPSPSNYVQHSPINLGFEQDATPGEAPFGWYMESNGYAVVNDSSEVYMGSTSVRISAEPGFDQFGALVQCVDASLFGHSVRLTGFIKTSNVDSFGWAGLWLRVDDHRGEVLAFDNMEGRGVTRTRGWDQHTVRLPVDYRANRVCFGGLLVGEGTAWFDAFDIR